MTELYACVIIGEPGIGKSTLVEALTRGATYTEYTEPFAYRKYDCGVVELGKRREGFSGTDALPMNVQPKVEQWLSDELPELLLFEGDRLSNGKFFTVLRHIGYTLHLYQLSGASMAAERRAARGSNQDRRWIEGRRTKALNLAVDFDAKQIHARLPPNVLAGMLNDPVAKAFRA